MKKFFLLVLCCLLYNVHIVEAQEFDTKDAFLIKIKNYRTDVYKSLDLTNEQKETINKIDEEFFNQARPELDEIYNYIIKLDNIANSPDCSKDKVDKVKKDFRVTEKKISKIKKEYNKDFNAVLTKQQKKHYKKVLKDKRKLLKQEVEYIKLKQKETLDSNNDK